MVGVYRKKAIAEYYRLFYNEKMMIAVSFALLVSEPFEMLFIWGDQ